MVDIHELTKEMRELQTKADRYDEIKSELENKTILIDAKLDEAKQLLMEINPLINLRKSSTRQKTWGAVANNMPNIMSFLKEHKNDEFSCADILREVNLSPDGGATITLQKYLRKEKGISIRKEGRKVLVSYKGEEKLSEGEIKEKITKKEVGDIMDGTKILKTSYMR